MGLSRLAALHGVATSFSPSAGVTGPVPEATVVAVLGALGVDATTPEAVRDALAAAESAARTRLFPDTLVVWSGEPLPPALTGLPPGTELIVRLEESAEEAEPVRMRVSSGEPDPAGPGNAWWAEPPLGVHRLTARAPGREPQDCTLVVAPARVPQPPARTHGFLVQLYSLLSARSWGMGDLGDLADLASWSGRRLGAGFVQVNPLHAAVPGAPTDPSPYRPSSRRFPDPVHLRVESVPEYGQVPDPVALDALRRKGAELREAVLDKGALIDRDAVWALKRQALDLVLAVPLTPGRHAEYCDFLADRGRPLEDHALWCALAEVHGPDWHGWPEELRDPRSDATARARAELLDRVDHHCRLAWLTATQLADAQRAAREAGMPVGVVHDLAVGVHPGGAD
ncbi:4-alpha-glucanotransferase, partial [Streptomyces sp. SID7909]|uniref:4-alpha-glucanotransferase n=1 Tax=Streptomyces sp. SID7909 TaxID=2706092 RepID=UPI0013BA78D1